MSLKCCQNKQLQTSWHINQLFSTIRSIFVPPVLSILMFIVCSMGVGLETGLFGLHYIRNEGISDHKRFFFYYNQCCFLDSVVIRMICVFKPSNYSFINM